MTEFPGVALITGAAGTGIGAAIAHAFVRAGCSKLAITDINPATLSETCASLKTLVDSLGGVLTLLALPGDISDPAFIDHLFDEIKGKFGRLDYAVNNAGIGGFRGPTSDATAEDFDRISNVNYRGVFLCSRKELQIMRNQHVREREGFGGHRRQRGAVVNIASQLGLVAQEGAAIYSSTKHAVIGLTRGDAQDHSQYHIRVNAVCPGVIATPLSLPDQERLTPMINMAPMRRMGTPEEVADVVLFLCSERASFVQGAAWVVDGGYTIV